MNFDMDSDDDDFNPYTSDNHTLIPHLYLYPFFSDNIGYVLQEPKTNQLVAIDVGCFESSKPVVEHLEKKFDTQLRYIFSTHKHDDHIGGNLQWAEHKKSLGQELDIISGAKSDGIPGVTKTLNDLEPFLVGDVSFCCLETPGHTDDHVSYVVTHCTPTSTKIPLLFCADTLFIGGCGRVFDGTAE